MKGDQKTQQGTGQGETTEIKFDQRVVNTEVSDCKTLRTMIDILGLSNILQEGHFQVIYS